MPRIPYNFKRGLTKVYLPNFTISLLRTPHLPPIYASFSVPLNFNKLDLRDYLFHAYNVRVLRIRSYVIQQKVKRYRELSRNSVKLEWWRPRSWKKMTVELEKPFVWPEAPEDLSPWDKELFDQIQEEREAGQKTRRRDADLAAPPDKEKISTQARELLEGKVQWQSGMAATLQQKAASVGFRKERE